MRTIGSHRISMAMLAMLAEMYREPKPSDGTRTMREPHVYPPNPFISRQVKRAMERAAKKADRKP